MRIAVIDIGSNTVKSAIYDVEKDRQIQCIHRKTVYLGLLSYIENNHLTNGGIDALSSAITVLKNVALSMKCHKIYAFATAALRMSQNNGDVISKVFEKTGVKIDLIDGDTEARLTYESAAQSTPDMKERGICVDLGGGSCEIIYFENNKIKDLVSLPLGTLLLYEKFVSNVIPTKEEFDAIKAHVFESLEGHDRLFTCPNIYLIGGSARAAVKTLKSARGIDPTLPCVIPTEYMNGFALELLELKKDAKRILMKEVPERAHTLMAGFALFDALAQKCLATELTVTDASVRDGYLKERLLKND